MRSYTNSELETAKRCLRKWFLSYVLERHKPERLHGSRQRGSLMHAGLELYYSTGDDPIDFIRAEGVRLRQAYVDSVEEPDEEELRDIEKMVDLVLAMLEGYLVWVSEQGVDADYEILGAEKEVSVSLEPHGVPVQLLGKLDIRVRRYSDGFRAFLDHKSVGDLVQLPKWAHMNPQLLTYHLIEYLTQQEQLTDGGIYNMLRTIKRTARANPPFYARHEVHHNLHQLRNFFTQTVALIQRLEQLRQQVTVDNHQYLCPPHPTGDCAWSCDFFTVCPMMDDGSDWQGLLENAYPRRDPLERYQLIEKG